MTGQTPRPGAIERESELPTVLRNICSALPQEHRALLAYLATFLTKVAAQSSTSMMTVQNLAKIFAPSLLKRTCLPHPPHLHTHAQPGAAAPQLTEPVLAGPVVRGDMGARVRISEGARRDAAHERERLHFPGHPGAFAAEC